MLEILLEFFAVHKKLSVPGVGTLRVGYEASDDQFGTKTIRPAKANIVFSPGEEESTIAGFEAFAKTQYHKSREELDRFYRRFAARLDQEHRLTIDGFGVLEKEDDRIKFRQTYHGFDFFPVLQVEKVIRENAEHTMTVGENERTSAQMREVLSQQESKKYWWVYVLIVLLIGAAGYYFYKFYFLKG